MYFLKTPSNPDLPVKPTLVPFHLTMLLILLTFLLEKLSGHRTTEPGAEVTVIPGMRRRKGVWHFARNGIDLRNPSWCTF